jgi:hypothetical protein
MTPEQKDLITNTLVQAALDGVPQIRDTMQIYVDGELVGVCALGALHKAIPGHEMYRCPCNRERTPAEYLQGEWDNGLSMSTSILLHYGLPYSKQCQISIMNDKYKMDFLDIARKWDDGVDNG